MRWDPVHDALSVENVVERALDIPPFTIETVDVRGNVVPWRVVDPKPLVAELVINPHRLRDQIDALPVQIGAWGRLCAQARRVWSIREREYRVWRSREELRLRDEGPKLTVAQAEAQVRIHDEYLGYQQRIEAAEEVYNITTMIYEAFRAKQRVLGSDVYRSHDGDVSRRSP